MSSIKDLIESIEAVDTSFDEKLKAITEMESTILAMREQEEKAVQDNVDLIVEAINVMQKKVDNQLLEIQQMIPEKGDKGEKGDRGADGKNGRDGLNGVDGRDGRDGVDGKDGVSVVDANIDFDGSLIIKLSNGLEINVGEVVAPDLQEKIKLVTSGGGGGVLPDQTGHSGQFLTTDGSTMSWGNALSSVTSTDGSVTVSTVSGVADLSVAVAASTTNVICQVRNTTGATLTKGTAVYISGATGQIPTVTKAQANSDAASAQTLGLMSADLANNSNGYVTIIGLITEIDTSAYTDGQQLYLSGTTAGGLTATKNYAPTHLVYVAVVEYAHAIHGKLFVKVQNGYELDEIHNVSAQTPSNGQTIVYNTTTSLWENSTVSLTAGVNGTLPIANGGTGATTLAGASIVTYSGTQTLTNKRIDPRVSSSASASSVTPDISAYDVYAFTALAATLGINAPIGTPVDGDKLIFRILDNGTTRTLNWNGTYTAIGVTLPTATTANKTSYIGCIYNANNTRWDVIAVTTQA